MIILYAKNPLNKKNEAMNIEEELHRLKTFLVNKKAPRKPKEANINIVIFIVVIGSK